MAADGYYDLAIGSARRRLRRYLRQFERTKIMFGKTKTQTTYTIKEATKELDAVLAKASGVFIHADRLVDLLESRVAAIRARQAASYSSVPALVSGNLPG
jgi:hypothetical protein